MKLISVLTFAFVAVAGTLAHADNKALLTLITSSKSYQEYTTKLGKGIDYKCESVAEALKSKGYSALPNADQSVFQMVILDCRVNPHDGGDAFGEKGLAVVKTEGKFVEVLSYTSSYYPQPD
jgi:hypothetical protein